MLRPSPGYQSRVPNASAHFGARRRFSANISVDRSICAGPAWTKCLRQALLLAVIGVAIGVPATLAATRLLQSELYGVSALNPATVATAATRFVIAALLAAALPSARAVSISPTEALQAG
jgi:hypothetical protein